VAYMDRVHERLMATIKAEPLGSRKLLNAVDCWIDSPLPTSELDELLADKHAISDRFDLQQAIRDEVLVGMSSRTFRASENGRPPPPDAKYVEVLGKVTCCHDAADGFIGGLTASGRPYTRRGFA